MIIFFSQLPKKRKKGTIVVDSSSGSESPVQFSYEKAATGPAFVPFDYSKAKIKTGMDIIIQVGTGIGFRSLQLGRLRSIDVFSLYLPDYVFFKYIF